MSNGLVTQIIGAVIDVEFDKSNIPNVYEALTISGMETDRKSTRLNSSHQ